MDRDILTYPGARRLFVSAAFLTLIEGLCIIGQAGLLAGLVSDLFTGRSISSMGNQIVLFFIVLAIRHLCVLTIKSLSFRFAERTSKSMRKRFLNKLFFTGSEQIRTGGSGTLVTLTLEGVAQVRHYLELFIPKIVANGILPLMILVYVLTKDWLSALILFLTMPVLIIFMILLGLAAQKKMDDRWASYRVLSNHFLDSLRGLPTLRYLGLGKIHAKTIERVSDKYRKMTMGTLKLAFLSSFALDFFTMLSIAFVAVALGLRLIDGHILLEPALTVLILAPEYFTPVRELGQDYHATLDGKEAAEKINHIAPQQEKEETTGEEASADRWQWSDHAILKLNEVSAVYQDSNGKKALNDISFSARGDETIGIIGSSGAGKSTLIDVIGGFLATASGHIEVNGVPGSFASGAWRKQVTYIPQHPYIFSASLGENVAFYQPDASGNQIREAVRAAGLDQLVKEFPGGLDEKIGAGGRPLSGGQEQRVALARAFLCNRPVLLLDEPTAHLDIETEYELKQTMIRLFKGKLVLMATHRLHWMDQMDRILVIDRGRIVESGPQDELIRKNGVYTRLVRSQLEGQS
jgi:ATP-binding cassette subfamily C protein CydD